MRFPTVLVRKWKYDESVPEYFVQTHDKVTVKRKDLEKAQWTEDMEPDEEMPEFEMMQLEPSATKEAPSALQAMASGGQQLNTADEAMNSILYTLKISFGKYRPASKNICESIYRACDTDIGQ